MRILSDIELDWNKVEFIKARAFCSDKDAVQALLDKHGNKVQAFRDVYKNLPFKRKQKWLMKLNHAAKCSNKDGQCPRYPDCETIKQLWKHVSKCNKIYCQYDSCWKTREILKHYRDFDKATLTTEEQRFVAEAAAARIIQNKRLFVSRKSIAPQKRQHRQEWQIPQNRNHTQSHHPEKSL